MSLVAAALAVTMSPGTGFATGDEENLSKLGAFKKTATGAMLRVDQDTKYADNLRKVLQSH